jgi:hypothetical protein
MADSAVISSSSASKAGDLASPSTDAAEATCMTTGSQLYKKAVMARPKARPNTS